MRVAGTGGAVLLFVLALVALLASLAVTTIRTAQVEVFAAYGGIYARQARATVESGLLAAAAVLLPAKPADSDNLTQDWAFFPVLASYPGASFLDGHLSGRIEDESGKFPINAMHPGLLDHAAYQAIFLRLLTGEALALPEDRAKALLAALVDWLDADDQPSSGGAEDAAYAAAQLPYRVRNNSLDTLGELLLIQGFSHDLLNGRGDRPGLLSLLTVWGSGLINVNTAPLPVLAALPSGQSAAQAAAPVGVGSSGPVSTRRTVRDCGRLVTTSRDSRIPALWHGACLSATPDTARCRRGAYRTGGPAHA